MITQKEIEFYHQEGYLVVNNVLSKEALNHIAEKIDDCVEGTYHNILNLHDRLSEVHDLLIHPQILARMDTIQSARMIPIGSIFFFCKPGNSLEQGSYMHQDNYAAKSPFGSYMVCAIAFDDADESNGALVVLPKTHKLGDLPNIPSKNFEHDEEGKIIKAYPIGNEVDIPAGYEKLQLNYKKGSLIFIHGHIVHGAPKNSSQTQWRRTLYMHYIKDGDPFWPGWNAKRRLIERQ